MTEIIGGPYDLRCQATTKAGAPCRGAVWTKPDRPGQAVLCAIHLHQRREQAGDAAWRRQGRVTSREISADLDRRSRKREHAILAIQESLKSPVVRERLVRAKLPRKLLSALSMLGALDIQKLD